MDSKDEEQNLRIFEEAKKEAFIIFVIKFWKKGGVKVTKHSREIKVYSCCDLVKKTNVNYREK